LVWGLVAVAAAALAVSASGQTSRRSLSPQMYAKVASGVALILTRDCSGHPQFQGTGFLVGKQLVMTARHVVAGACAVRVVLDGHSYQASTVRFWSSRASTATQVDVATMKLDHPAPGFVFAVSGGSPPIGSVLAMIGHPLGNPLSLSQGQLRGKPIVGGVPELAIWMLSAEGASGSPILNRFGDVVGILQQGITRSDAGFIFGINLARAWGRQAEKDLCKAYPLAGVPGCAPKTTPPPPPAGATVGHYCGGVTDGNQTVCFDIAPYTLTVDNFTFQAIVTCTDASKWTWTLSAPQMPTLPDGTFSYSETDSSTSSTDPSFTNLVISYSLTGVVDGSGFASGDYQVTSMSWDRNGVHYDCSGFPESWTASTG
jgi:hypothetical protein